MNRSALFTTEKKHKYPILIVDKKGDIGEELAKKLKDESLVVFVSKKKLEIIDNVVHVPFFKKIPKVPDNTYSHIILIDEDLQVSKTTIQSFIKKAKNDNSFLVLVVPLALIDESFLNNFISSYDKAKLAILGDIFTKNTIYDSSTEINRFIIEAKTLGKINIPGDGTREVYPILLDDVVEGILEAIFGGEKNKIFYLFPKHKITLLTLSHTFQKADPNLRLDFVKDQKTKPISFIPKKEGVYLTQDPYILSEKIKSIEFQSLKIEKTEENKPKSKYENGIKVNFAFIYLSFIFFLLMPFLSTLFLTIVGVNALYLVKNEVEKGNFSSLKPKVIIASKSFRLAKASLSVLSKEAEILGQREKIRGLESKINLGRELSDAAISVIDASSNLKKIAEGVSSDPTSDFSNSLVELKSAFYVYDKEKKAGLIPVSITRKLSDITNLAQATVDFWPDIFGFKGQKTYLVLFQNNMELRPGGGFIGSYAVATVDKGKVIGFKIYDVYDADGQLRGHVEPPFPIRRYLPSVHWYLRDSNFNVDFSKGALASAVFLNSEMHQAVDGVIAVDLSFIKSLLSVLGPVKVTDYNVTVTEDNFFQVTQTHVEKDFFPGSTQKKDFLRSFYNSLQLKISESKNLSYLNLLEALANSIYEKHVLFAFNNVNEQAVFAINGWSSALIDNRGKNSQEINDFIGINEANLGVDKVNYFVTRSISQNVSLASDGSVSENLIIAFKNTAEENSWTGGLYKNYLRIILPSGSKILKIEIDGKEQKIVPAVTDPTVYEKKNFTPPEGLEVQKEEIEKNTIYGFLVMLKPGDLRTIQIRYDLVQKLDLSKADFSYNLKVFKQPGVDFHPFDFSLSFPQNLKVVSSSSEVKTNSGKALLSTQITRDKEVTINLAPK